MNTFKGDLSFLNDCEYGQEIVDLMLTRQFEQTGKRDITVFERRCIEDVRKGGITYDNTPEGFDFWYQILGYRNPSHFRTVYPKKGEEQSMICPFCGEVDFDRSGLKYHLERYCEEYDKTELPIL